MFVPRLRVARVVVVTRLAQFNSRAAVEMLAFQPAGADSVVLETLAVDLAWRPSVGAAREVLGAQLG